MADRPFNPRQIEWPLSASTWNWWSRPQAVSRDRRFSRRVLCQRRLSQLDCRRLGCSPREETAFGECHCCQGDGEPRSTTAKSCATGASVPSVLHSRWNKLARGET